MNKKVFGYGNHFYNNCSMPEGIILSNCDILTDRLHVDRAMLFLCLGSFSGKAKFILKLCLTYFNLFTLFVFFKVI